MGRKDLWAAGVALALALTPLRSFLWQTDWPTHDVHSYGIRLAALVCALDQGQWLGRWCPVLDRGYGYPLFTYYAAGFYLLAAGFFRAGLGISAALKAALILMQLAGAGGMYALGRLFFGRCGAAVSALLWAFLPYQQTNLFVRGALGEFAALHCLGFAAFGGLLALKRGSAGWAVLGAAFHAFLVVNHAITALAATPVLLAVFVWGDWHFRRRIGWRPFASIALALGLSAFYWLPALACRAWVNPGALLLPHLRPESHFLEWPQWFNVFYWGYGPSVPGPGDGMALHVGLGPLALTAAAWWTVAWRRRPGERIPWPLLAGSVLTAPVLLLTLESTRPLWDRLPLLRYVQFPWRLLGEAGFLMAWGAGAALDVPMRRGMGRKTRLATTAAVAALAAAAPPWHSGGLRDEKPFVSERPDQAELLAHDWAVTAGDEFLPRDVNEKWPALLPPRRARTLDSSGAAEAVEGPEADWTITVQRRGPGRVAMGVYWFPEWILERNGRRVPCRPMERYGLVEFDAPAGDSVFHLHLGRTPIQRAADGVSGLAVAVCAGMVAARAARKRRRKPDLEKASPPARNALRSPSSWSVPDSAILFLFVLGVLTAFIDSNDLTRFDLHLWGIHTLAETGHVHLDSWKPLSAGFYGDTFIYHGHRYALKQPGVVFLGAAVYSALRPLGVTFESNYLLAAALVTFVVSTLPVAIMAVLFFGVVKRITGRRRVSALITCIMVFGTPLFPYSGVTHHDVNGTLFSFAAFCLLYYGRHAAGPARPWVPAAAGLLAGLALFSSMLQIPVTAAICAYAVVTSVRWRGAERSEVARAGPAPSAARGDWGQTAFRVQIRWPELVGFAVFFLVGLAPTVMFNTWLFGGPFRFPNVVPRIPDNIPNLSLVNVLRRLRFYLLSPATGLLYYCPIFAFALAGFAFLGRRHAVERILLPLSFLLLLASVCTMSTTGHLQYGPRYLLPGYPFALIGLAGFWAEDKSRAGAAALAGHKSLVAIVVGVAAVSVVLSLPGAAISVMHPLGGPNAFVTCAARILKGDFPAYPLAIPGLSLVGAAGLLYLGRRRGRRTDTDKDGQA